MSLSHKMSMTKDSFECYTKSNEISWIFVRSDGNQEFTLHPEIILALKKIDENSTFNSLFLLFS